MQEATGGLSLANPDGVIHEVDVLRRYGLVRCGGNAGRGYSELLGKCGPVGCCLRP